MPGFFPNMSDAVPNLRESLDPDNLLGDLFADPAVPNEIDEESGTAPSYASGYYKNLIAERGLGPKMWYTNGQDWYKVFGYRFSIAFLKPSVAKDVTIDDVLTNKRYGGGAGSEDSEFSWLHFTLPIPPSQYVVKPIYASKITPTLGGVTEETSQVKMWVISLSGSTGTAITRTEEDRSKRMRMATRFRETIETTGLLSGTFAGANSLVSKFGGIVDQAGNAVNALGEGDIAGATSGVTGAINQALAPSIPYANSAVDSDANGFTEAQELQKFFFMYNALKARYPDRFALLYTDFKTDQSWRCAAKDVSLQKNAENAYLYRYTISLQAWDVMASRLLFGSQNEAAQFDRFAPDGDLAPVNTLQSDQILGVFNNVGNNIVSGGLF